MHFIEEHTEVTFFRFLEGLKKTLSQTFSLIGGFCSKPGKCGKLIKLSNYLHMLCMWVFQKQSFNLFPSKLNVPFRKIYQYTKVTHM